VPECCGDEGRDHCFGVSFQVNFNELLFGDPSPMIGDKLINTICECCLHGSKNSDIKGLAHVCRVGDKF
jgi:hypothetical protein